MRSGQKGRSRPAPRCAAPRLPRLNRRWREWSRQIEPRGASRGQARRGLAAPGSRPSHPGMAARSAQRGDDLLTERGQGGGPREVAEPNVDAFDATIAECTEVVDELPAVAYN